MISGMRVATVVIFGLACAACGRDFEQFPTDPHGGGGGGGIRPGGNGSGSDDIDAGVDALNGLDGRACLILDSRDIATCQDTGAGQIKVEVAGVAAVQTADNGDFTIETPTGTGLVWRLTNNDLVTSVQQFGAPNQIPILQNTTYDDMTSAFNVTFDTATEGAIIVTVLQNKVPLQAATVDLGDPTAARFFYDGVQQNDWLEGQVTKEHGAAWITNVPFGNHDVIVTPAVDPPVTAPAVPVQANSITYVVVNVP